MLSVPFNGSRMMVIKAVDCIVTVTSCWSDAYHNQQALGAISKLPRHELSALKTFHELALGIKDAYKVRGFCDPKAPPGDNGGRGIGGIGSHCQSAKK